MADVRETERRQKIIVAAHANLTVAPAPTHPVTAAKPAGESERVALIINSNLAARND